MRKIYTLIAALTASLTIQAQSLTYTGLTANVYGSISDSIIQSSVYIINSSQNTLDVSLNAYDVSIVPGTEHSFCWGILCYGVGTMSSAIPATINAGDTESSFKGDYLAHGNVGTSTVAYTFFDSNDSSDSLQLTINYRITPVGFNELKSVNTISAPSPNPAKNITSFNYNLKSGNNAEIKVVNLLGKTVKQFNLNTASGNVILSTADMRSGDYLVTLSVEGKSVAVQKLIVNR